MAQPAARVVVALLLATSALVLALPTALAHGVGAGLDDGPVARFALPPWAVWVTGAAVVGLSFLIVAAFVTRPGGAAVVGSRTTAAGAPTSPRIERSGTSQSFVQGGMLALLLTACASAFFPASESRLPLAWLWLFAWTLVPFVAYTLGDAWRTLDAFHALGRIADRIRGGRAPPLRYPARLGAWPAVLLLLAATGFEVWSAGRLGATGVARVLLAYVALTFAGMLAFGASTWREHVDLFTRYYRALAAASILFRDASPTTGERRLRLRPPWRGLSALDARGPGEVALLVAVLYGVNFDGFLATPPGRVALDALIGATGSSLAAHALLLAAGYLVFLGAFLGTAAAIRDRSESLEPVSALASRFAASLVPIAVAYHAAHNLPYLYENAPSLALALLDPLGLGWAAGLGVPDTLPFSVLALDALALAQLLLIVGGHVVAVVGAHDLALRGVPSLVQAFRSEIPLTRVMVFYTLIGLWIVATATHAAAPGVGA